MISKISIQNFKLHKSTEIEATPVTIFIGPNNSGKSSIFQALITLRGALQINNNLLIQSYQRNNTDYRNLYLYPQFPFIDVGEFKDVVRDSKDKIIISLKGRIQSHLKNIAEIEVGLEVHYQNNNFVYSKGLIKSSQYEFTWERGQNSGTVTPPSIQVDEFNIGISPNVFGLGFGLGYPSNTSPEKVAEIQQFFNTLFDSPSQLIRSIHPIYSLRGFEEWAYPLPDYAAGSLDMAVLADRSIALTSILAYNRKMVNKLSEWLKEVLGVEMELDLFPPKRVTIRTKEGNTLFVNEGTGANQLPFILLPIGLMPPNETVLISEPEAHLHPKAQSNLVSLFLKILKKENKQFFIETHSEHILHAFLYALARKEITRDQLSIYYFENVGGTSKARCLEIDNKGRVDGGLPGFFEHSLMELSEYLDALKSN